MERNKREVFNQIYERDNESLEMAILELKKLGCSQIETVGIIKDELNISLKEADSVVLHSKAWEKERNETINLRKRFNSGLFDES